MDMTSGEQSEEVFDPTKSVMTDSQVSQDGRRRRWRRGFRGRRRSCEAGGETGDGVEQLCAAHGEDRYQSSRTVKHTKLPQGSIKRLSLSVLVDHTVRFEGAKRIIETPSAEKLKVMKNLVTAAAGLDTARGDQLVVESFPFESTVAAEALTMAPAAAPAAPAETAMPAWLKNKRSVMIAGIGAGALIALLVGFMIMRRKSKAKTKMGVEQTPALAAGGPQSVEQMTRQIEAKVKDQAAEKARLEAEELMALKVPAVKTQKTEVLSEKHRE